MSPAPPAAPVAVLERDEHVAAVLSPLRRRLLQRLREEPDSAAGLSRKLGLPRQKLNYHLRALEDAGLVELDEERQRRGCVERALRPTARALVISSRLLGELAADPDTIQDRLSSAYQVALAARIVRDVTHMGRKAAAARQKLPTLSLQTEVRFRDAQRRAAFAEELAGALARLAAKYHDDGPGARAFRFSVAGHPVPKPEKEAE